GLATEQRTRPPGTRPHCAADSTTGAGIARKGGVSPGVTTARRSAGGPRALSADDVGPGPSNQGTRIMGYTLIWIESLASALLLVALGTAWSAWRSRPFWQRIGPVAFTLALIAVPALLTYGLGLLRFRRGMEIGWFSYMLLWTVAFAGAAGILLFWGLRKRREEAAPAARDWSIAKLALAAAAMVLLSWMTFSNMDLA